MTDERTSLTNNITMSIIKSIKQTDFTVIITTKSNVVRIYKFDTIKECNEYFYSMNSYVNMSRVKLA